MELNGETISPLNIFIEVIRQEKKKEVEANIWSESIFKDICTLESNNVGNVGEKSLQKLCESLNIESCIDGTKTKEISGKEGGGDGCINKKTVEIKTARLGSTEKSFQHELGEHPWKAMYMVFVDVAPSCIYFTVFPNFNEEHYKNELKCEPYFPSKKVTRRKHTGAFKLDTSPKINESLILTGNCFKFTETTTFEEVKLFINRVIV
jgi:hypothetical protein